MTVEIFLSDYQSIVSGVFRTCFSTTDKEHFFCCLTVDCLCFQFFLHFIVLQHVFWNGRRMGIIQCESHGNGNKT